MKIIDKNTDFYDFYQNVYPDNTFTFDRRSSWILTKEIMCENLIAERYWTWKEKKDRQYKKYNYLLLQICNNFWLFKVELLEMDNFDRVKDYKIELLYSWKNFDKPRVLIELQNIRFTTYYGWRKEPTITDRVNDINQGNYGVRRHITDRVVWIGGEKKEQKHIPILKASGIAPLIDAHEVFLAFEQYFALEKSDSERREPLGTTDIDKVESHGFDKVTSFRGK